MLRMHCEQMIVNELGSVVGGLYMAIKREGWNGEDNELVILCCTTLYCLSTQRLDTAKVPSLFR
mgnify:CR=1 FL=1